jgi:fluoroquinolone transport system permease protein
MKGLLRLLRLDLTLQARSFIYPATAVSTAMICSFVVLLPGGQLSPRLTAFFVFMDPAIIGLSFVGAMVLMEKASGTLYALGVTPTIPASYVGAKTVSLTLLTFASSMVVVGVATGGAFDLFRQTIAITLCSTVAVVIGLLCVARVASMNQLVVRLTVVTTLLYVPLLSHFDVLRPAFTPVVAVIPSYAMLVALESSVDPSSASVAAQVSAPLYLVAWIVVGWHRTVKGFESVIVTEGK